MRNCNSYSLIIYHYCDW